MGKVHGSLARAGKVRQQVSIGSKAEIQDMGKGEGMGAIWINSLRVADICRRWEGNGWMMWEELGIDTRRIGLLIA